MRATFRSLVDLAAIAVAAFLFVEQLGDPVARLQARVESHLESFQRSHEEAQSPDGSVEGGLDIVVCSWGVMNDFDAGRQLGLLAVAGSGLPLALIAVTLRRSRYWPFEPERAGSLFQSARILQGWSCTLAGLVTVPVMLIDPATLLQKWPLAWLAATFIAGLVVRPIWKELSVPASYVPTIRRPELTGV